jgi:hypothetical protein
VRIASGCRTPDRSARFDLINHDVHDSLPGTVGGMTACWVSREAGTADYGTVLTGEPDDHSLAYNAAAMDADRASGPARAELFSAWVFGCLRRSGGFSCADFDVRDS